MHIPEGTLISVDELNQYPPEQVVLITTGSQGEPLSALSRMASCSHRQVRDVYKRQPWYNALK